MCCILHPGMQNVIYVAFLASFAWQTDDLAVKMRLIKVEMY